MRTLIWGPNPNRRFSGALHGAGRAVLRVVLAVSLLILIVGCPPVEDPPDDPPSDPPPGDPPPDDRAFLMDSVPREGLDRILFNQSETEKPEDSESDLRAPPYDSDPDAVPEGASIHDRGIEMVEIEVPLPQVFSREAPRDGQPPVRDWRELRFSGGISRPQAPGLDPAMADTIRFLAGVGRAEVYGFLLSDEYLSAPHFEVLAKFGVRVLGNHGSAYKVAVPINPDVPESVAEGVADLDFVYWLGFSLPEQKLHQDLQQLLDERAQLPSNRVPAQLPAYVNLFDDALPVIEALGRLGVLVGSFDSDLLAYRTLIPWDAIDALIEEDYVLFIEPVLITELDRPDFTLAKLDESTPTVGADYIRPNFDGSGITYGIMDSGFNVGSASPITHQDLNKWGRGRNFTEDAAGVWHDQEGHGTFVLSIAASTGIADSRYRGVAPGIGSSSNFRIRGAKVFNATGFGNSAWNIDAMDWLAGQGAHVVNYSGRDLDGQTRKMDAMAWSHRQFYVASAGNSGPGAQTITSPAKTAMTVGNVRKKGFQQVGRVWTTSSRGPTSDDRIKPNIVAPGTRITGASHLSGDGYTTADGTSLAAPHVSGAAASIMQHYPSFQWRPMLLRAWLMATAVLPEDDTSLSEANSYGLGRLSTYKAHWKRDNPNGWRGHWSWRQVHSKNYGFRDIEVPPNTHRLVVVMTWDEPPASAGAIDQRLWDLELWLQHNPGKPPADPWTNVPPPQFRAWSWVDNVVYLIVERPAAGTWRMKSVPYDAPNTSWQGYSLPVGMAAVVIRGNTQPDISLTATAAPSGIVPRGETFEIRTTVSNPSYILSGVHIENTARPGVRLVDVRTTRADGVTMDFTNAAGNPSTDFTLGNIVQGRSRTVIWTFEAQFNGSHNIRFRAWSENGGTRELTVPVSVQDL